MPLLMLGPSFRLNFSGRSTDEQAAPAGVSGWMQQLLTKVLANMSIEVNLSRSWCCYRHAHFYNLLSFALAVVSWWVGKKPLVR